MDDTSLDIVGIIINSINSIFSKLFSSVDNNLYSILDDLFFINEDIMNNIYLGDFFGSRSSGLILICNSLIIGFLLYYSISLIFSYFTFSNVQRPNEFIFRVFLCLIAVNFSPFICKQLIWLISLVSLAIRELGENILGTPICFTRDYSKFQFFNFYRG